LRRGAFAREDARSSVWVPKNYIFITGTLTNGVLWLFFRGKGLTSGMKGAYNNLTCLVLGKYALSKEVVIWNDDANEGISSWLFRAI